MSPPGRPMGEFRSAQHEGIPMSTALRFDSGDEQTELERAETYGLLAALWLAPPDAALLAQFAHAVTEAPEPGAFLEAPWVDLVGALRQTTPEAARAEYEALFHGVGKADIFLYGSHHLAGMLNDRPLARLRADLIEMGVERDEARAETEDHVAFVFEVMRYLIAGDDVAVCNLERQRRFFRDHLQSWVPALCDAVLAHPRARVWRAVAAYTAAFQQVETQGFDLLES